MNEVYVPNFDSNNCVVIQSSDVVRVYDRVPTYNSTINYRDYFIKSNYIYNTGSQSFSNYATLPVCIANERITTDVFYRNDIHFILIIFVIMAFISFWVPWRLITRIFRRWR